MNPESTCNQSSQTRTQLFKVTIGHEIPAWTILLPLGTNLRARHSNLPGHKNKQTSKQKFYELNFKATVLTSKVGKH